MHPEKNITKQLIEQNIEFELIQNKYDSRDTSEVSKIIAQWKKKFIGNKTAPYLENYLWHIFSYGATKSKEGKEAQKELNKQYDTDTLIFNEPQQFLIRCKGKIPKIEMDDFSDDIYISHHNMKWTFVIPHEVPEIGPYFSYGTE